MTFAELVEAVAVTEITLDDAKKTLDINRKAAWMVWQEENSTASTIERWNVFKTYGAAMDYSYLVPVVNSKGHSLWYSCFDEFERHLIINLEDLDRSLIEEISISELDRNSWLEELMRINFRSMKYDW